MTVATSVPVIVTPEAAERVAELGMQAELEQMIEHTRHTVSELLRIDVVLAEPYDTGDETSIIIEPLIARAPDVNDRTEWDWGGWKVATFPPDVCRYFVMMLNYECNHAR